MFKMKIGAVKDCPIKRFRPIQINNMKIKWSKLTGRFDVVTPDGRVLEDFDALSSAKRWAESTHDFINMRTFVNRKKRK